MEALTIGVDDPGDFGDRVDSVLATREWNPPIANELAKGSETELWNRLGKYRERKKLMV